MLQTVNLRRSHHSATQPACLQQHFPSCYLSSDIPIEEGSKAEEDGVPAQEEGENDISETQSVCETVIHSVDLEDPQDHSLLQEAHSGTTKGQSEAVPGLKTNHRYNRVLLPLPHNSP